MNSEKLALELEAKKQQSRVMKRKILTSAVTVLVICAILSGVMILIDSGWFFKETDPPAEWYEFAPITDFNYNVMEDEWYKNQLEIGPIIRYHNAQTGSGKELRPDQYDEYGKATRCIIDLVIAIQQGDRDAYNSCFSDAYLIAEGKKKAEAEPEKYSYADTDAEYIELGKKSEFTMQQIYDVVITSYSEAKDDDGILSCVFELKYKIHMNNGTLRNDMGSDCYRAQRITVIENNDTEELEIMSVSNFAADVTRYTPIVWRIVVVTVLSLVVIVVTLVLAVRFVKRNTEPKEESDETKDKSSIEELKE